MVKFIAFFLICFSGCVYAEVYKWVDKDGVTHFGSQPPTDVDVQSMNIDNSARNVADAVDTSSVKTKSNTRKTLSDNEKAIAASLVKAIMTDRGDAEEVDCNRAVSNAISSIDGMLSVGKQNRDDGYMSDAEYNGLAGDLRKVKDRISLSECDGASGQVEGFYKCMTNDHNHIATCGSKYDYGS